MPKPPYRRRWAWVHGHSAVEQEPISDVERASYAFSGLADQGLMTTRQLADFQDATGLADFAWRAFWNKTSLRRADDQLRRLMRRTQGFVIFMQGWGGGVHLWDPLPALVCAANPRLVALAPDLNGFGRSSFLSDFPSLDKCDPHGVMRAVACWVELLGLRSGPRASKRLRVITFVGHSTSGAALFHLRSQDWRDNEQARCAIAPTLLGNDQLSRQFNAALGLKNNPREKLKSRLPATVVDKLLSGASRATRSEYRRVIESTPQGTLTQTFYALQASQHKLKSQDWSNFQVILGHDDRLVNVSSMLDFLDELGFAPNQIQVVMGNHYLFHGSDHDRRAHLRNRETVLGEILYLHEQCREKQMAASRR